MAGGIAWIGCIWIGIGIGIGIGVGVGFGIGIGIGFVLSYRHFESRTRVYGGKPREALVGSSVVEEWRA